MSWIDVWTWVLLFGVGLFVLISVIVGIRGFFDLRAMFRDLSTEPSDDA